MVSTAGWALEGQVDQQVGVGREEQVDEDSDKHERKERDEGLLEVELREDEHHDECEECDESHEDGHGEGSILLRVGVFLYLYACKRWVVFLVKCATTRLHVYFLLVGTPTVTYMYYYYPLSN